ncbi:camp independent regulatory protein [Seiridium cupressi]
MDALYLLEWCLRGLGSYVPRRPRDHEREVLIASGNIFVYKETADGIKRWTDGVSWSPSRILGNFLIYRELNEITEPGQKKKAKPKREKGIMKVTNQRVSPIGQLEPMTSNSFSDWNGFGRRDSQIRALVGSLIDSYQFKEGGLIKKTMSLSYNNITHHIISYYSIEDVQSGKLKRPCETFLGRHSPRSELMLSSSFRAPADDGGILAMPHGYRFDGHSLREFKKYQMMPVPLVSTQAQFIPQWKFTPTTTLQAFPEQPAAPGNVSQLSFPMPRCVAAGQDHTPVLSHSLDSLQWHASIDELSLPVNAHSYSFSSPEEPARP